MLLKFSVITFITIFGKLVAIVKILLACLVSSAVAMHRSVECTVAL